MSTSARVLVVEDELAIQELIGHSLKRAGHTVIFAEDAEQAMKVIKDILPDLLLLDLMLPGINGVELIRILRGFSRTKILPIILLTARSAESDIVSGLEAGADDYITKPFSPRELISRIKAVLRRRAPELVNDIVEIRGLSLDPTTHRVTIDDQNVEVGPTEFRLLHFFMTHPERVYTRLQLLNEVWGDHVFIQDRTVDVHIRRLRKILQVFHKEDILQTVRGSGYRMSIKTSH